jgi:RimJ/RimL family protein N-acetyltransferase
MTPSPARWWAEPDHPVPDARIEPSHPADPPPGYPARYERLLRLRDGREAFVRPIIPADAAALAKAIVSADPETLRRRFLGGPPPVTDALLTHLTSIDYARRFALVAGEPSGCGIGIARYEAVDDTVAEVAVAVDPGWRRVGLGTELITILAHAAMEHGIHTFTATYLAQNRPVEALLDHADGTGRTMISLGIAEAAVALNEVGWQTGADNGDR